jgi:hypothetical protein
MIHFVYLHYGPSENLRRELKYSFLTLRRFLDPAQHRVAIYTDAPDLFAAWPVAVLSIADKVDEYSAAGRYNHRIKLAVLSDALGRFGDAVLLDSDSIVLAGFPASVAGKLRHGAVMNRFEVRNPAPELAGFETSLPQAGRYRYDPERSVMFNSGIIGATAAHVPVVEDALALVDAFLARPTAPETARRGEQIAMSEAFRVHGVAIAEIYDTFLHYWKRSWKRYADYRLATLLPADWNDLRMPAAELTFSPLAVRLVSLRRSVSKRVRKRA